MSTTKKPTAPKPTIVKVTLRELTESEWNHVMEVPENVLLNFARFWTGWTSVPPLSRAGAASQLLVLLHSRFSLIESDRNTAQAYSLRRRIAVLAHISASYDRLAGFVAGLVRQADSEAEAQGLQADVTAFPVHTFRKEIDQ